MVKVKVLIKSRVPPQRQAAGPRTARQRLRVVPLKLRSPLRFMFEAHLNQRLHGNSHRNKLKVKKNHGVSHHGFRNGLPVGFANQFLRFEIGKTWDETWKKLHHYRGRGQSSNEKWATLATWPILLVCNKLPESNDVGVSRNGAYPQSSSILVGFSILNL